MGVQLGLLLLLLLLRLRFELKASGDNRRTLGTKVIQNFALQYFLFSARQSGFLTYRLMLLLLMLLVRRMIRRGGSGGSGGSSRRLGIVATGRREGALGHPGRLGSVFRRQRL